MFTNEKILNTSASIHPEFEAIIGIEVHVQLNTETKIFCSDSTNFSASDNENISAISLGMPGTLPLLNKAVINKAVRTGLALNCSIRSPSYFARKNYFYPDLPKGYQISQFEKPICENGFLEISVNGNLRRISITRAHLEEDAGKSIHFPTYSLLNYNRAGIPLLEIVSGPDMQSAEEAAEYCRMIRAVVQYVGVCDGNLEEGSFRCDCNVSVRRKGDQKLGTRVEIKNLNSFRFIEKAINFEIERQIDQNLSGQQVQQETRLYDSDKNRTFVMRTKEEAHDYRYFVDPDLLPIIISNEEIENQKQHLPELPLEKIRRYISEFSLLENEAQVLVADIKLALFFEATAKLSQFPKASAHWILGELLRYLNLTNLKLENSRLTPEKLSHLIVIVENKTVNLKIAKLIFLEMLDTDLSIEEIINLKGYVKISDDNVIKNIILQVLKDNPQQVLEYKNGKVKVFGFFVGAIMKETKGQADTDLVNSLLKKALAEEKT